MVATEKTAETNPRPVNENNSEIALPWSDLLDWTLEDSLPKYTFVLPAQGGEQKVYTLWRTMVQEVTELHGYPLDFLQEQLARKQSLNATLMTKSGSVLPYLDQYTFKSSGGLSGRVYGAAGVADGTKIETSPVENIQVTLPKGFVQTQDGKVAYELGTGMGEIYSLDGTTSRVSAEAISSAFSSRLGDVNIQNKEEETNQMLLKLVGTTGIVLGGALAMNILSHHLTINVFWV